jgi:hypothetical protein
MLKLRLERYSRGADAEMALVDGRALAMWRKSTLAAVGFVLIFGGSRAWTLIEPWFSRVTWYENEYRTICDAAVGLMLSAGGLVVMILVVVELFTDVDGRGIHRPPWAGGDFIPWSSVTKVSVGERARFLEVRAGKKKVMLGLQLFCNPAALVALIRLQVPPDRLKDI